MPRLPLGRCKMPDFDLFAHFYDADMGNFADDLPLYRELARRNGGPILDPMCGTGRVVLSLAAAGFQTVGLDIAPAMLRIAEHKRAAQHLHQRAHFQQGDIRSLKLEQQFGLVLVPMNSFMHLETVADQLSALQAIKQHLRPDGLVVLDLFNPDPQDLMTDQGVLVHERTFTGKAGLPVQKFVMRRTDVAQQRQDVTFIYDELHEDGRVQRVALPFVMRWLYRYELQHLLARVGLAVDASYGDYDLAPYSSASPQLIVIARAA